MLGLPLSQIRALERFYPSLVVQGLIRSALIIQEAGDFRPAGLGGASSKAVGLCKTSTIFQCIPSRGSADMRYTSVTAPRYAAADQSAIQCTVIFVLKEGSPGMPAVAAVPEVPEVLPTFNDKGVMLAPGKPAVPAVPGRPAVPAVPDTLSDPWPFMASPNDVEAHGREIYARAKAGEFGPVAAYLPPPPPAPVVPASITRRQCAIELLNRAMITDAEALAMVQTGAVPAFVRALIDQIPAADRIRAFIDFAADTYNRNNPLFVYLMSAAGKTPADIDAFFIAAATR